MNPMIFLRKKWHNDIRYMTEPIIDIRNEFIKNLNNEALIRQGLTEKDSPYYEIHKKIPLYDCNDEKCKLCRVGGEGDGGYVMVLPFSNNNSVAYSFGISTDVSWDLDMAKMGYDVFMYDHTIEGLPEENKRFHWKKEGIGGVDEEKNNLKTISTLIDENQHIGKSNMILKMDVEGAEWDVFSNISKEVLLKFDQIVIEMHDLLEYPKRPEMAEALDMLSSTHGMVHIHPNNYRGVDFFGSLVTPDVVEATFLLKDNHNLSLSNRFLPSEYDRANSDVLYDIRIGHWNVI